MWGVSAFRETLIYQKEPSYTHTLIPFVAIISYTTFLVSVFSSNENDTDIIETVWESTYKKCVLQSSEDGTCLFHTYSLKLFLEASLLCGLQKIIFSRFQCPHLEANKMRFDLKGPFQLLANKYVHELCIYVYTYMINAGFLSFI